MTTIELVRTIQRTKWHLKLPFFITIDNRGIRFNVQLPGYTFGVRMFFTKKKKRVVRPLQREVDQFLLTRHGTYGTFSTVQDHKHFIEQFIDTTGIESVEDIDDRAVSSYIEGIHDIEQTVTRRLTASVAIRQFVAYMNRKEIEKQKPKIGRPPKVERNLEMIALRKFDPKKWSIGNLATKYSITKRAVWEILDRHKDILEK